MKKMTSQIMLLTEFLVSSFLISCGQHNPQNPLNPESSVFVGEENAQSDTNQNGIADVLEMFPGCNGDIACSSDSLSELVLSIRQTPTSSNSADSLQDSSKTSSSSAAIAYSLPFSLPASSSSEVPTSSLALSSSLEGSSSSGNTMSSSQISSSSVDSSTLVTITIVGGTFSDQSTSKQLEPNSRVNIVADHIGDLDLCFDGWEATAGIFLPAEASSTSYRVSSSDATITANTHSCPGQFTDARDGHIYGYTVVGSAVWMSENLKYISPYSWCYEDDSTKCANYGRLYTWASAMNLDVSNNSSNAGDVSSSQGNCPANWHVPTKVQMASAVTELSLPSGGNQVPDYVGATTYHSEAENQYGFYWTSETGQADVLPTDDRDFCEHTGSSAYCATVYVDKVGGSGDWWRYAQEDDKYLGFSVRCILD